MTLPNFDICFKQTKYFLHFFGIFLTLPSTQTIKVIDLIFLMTWLKNWSMNIHFNPIPILQGLFLMGGGVGRPPTVYTQIRTPLPLQGQTIIFLHSNQFFCESGKNHWSKPDFHWRPLDFIVDPHFFIRDPFFSLQTPRFVLETPKIFIED